MPARAGITARLRRRKPAQAGANRRADSVAERTLLIQDAWSRVRVDKIKIGDFLALADALKNDPTPAVMDNLASDLVKIETDIVVDNHRSQYQQ